MNLSYLHQSILEKAAKTARDIELQKQRENNKKQLPQRQQTRMQFRLSQPPVALQRDPAQDEEELERKRQIELNRQRMMAQQQQAKEQWLQELQNRKMQEDLARQQAQLAMQERARKKIEEMKRIEESKTITVQTNEKSFIDASLLEKTQPVTQPELIVQPEPIIAPLIIEPIIAPLIIEPIVQKETEKEPEQQIEPKTEQIVQKPPQILNKIEPGKSPRRNILKTYNEILELQIQIGIQQNYRIQSLQDLLKPTKILNPEEVVRAQLENIVVLEKLIAEQKLHNTVYDKVLDKVLEFEKEVLFMAENGTTVQGVDVYNIMTQVEGMRKGISLWIK
ncbi:Hypothetical_protein [Hexamita inflata]|uniref:Hypothetical_protein n=1 Tax=Hexamita inflata TaxID=28002 RepID=A0AA86UI48_9EUKA|nr:Hypothetical protein HINF_LOCUS39737 [Hexamita inflata]